MTTTKTYPTATSAVSFETVAGGVRVRREGKGDTLFITHDDRARSITTHLVIMHGVGVIGRVARVDGEWFTETGVYRPWEAVGTPYQVFPSSTVVTDSGYPTMTEAVAELALHHLS
jgi:hypothetical protein